MEMLRLVRAQCNRSQLSDGMERAWSISRPKNQLIIDCDGEEEKKDEMGGLKFT